MISDLFPVVSLGKTRETRAGDRRETRDARLRAARGVMGKLRDDWGRVSNDLYFQGLIAQETDGNVATFGSQFVAATYVKFIESAGGRMVPILYPLAVMPGFMPRARASQMARNCYGS